MVKFLSNKLGFEGSGNGDALRTAASIDRCTDSSPLHVPIETPVTSPPGVCLTWTIHSMSRGCSRRFDPVALQLLHDRKLVDS